MKGAGGTHRGHRQQHQLPGVRDDHVVAELHIPAVAVAVWWVHTRTVEFTFTVTSNVAHCFPLTAYYCFCCTFSAYDQAHIIQRNDGRWEGIGEI